MDRSVCRTAISRLLRGSLVRVQDAVAVADEANMLHLAAKIFDVEVELVELLMEVLELAPEARSPRVPEPPEELPF